MQKTDSSRCRCFPQRVLAIGCPRHLVKPPQPVPLKVPQDCLPPQDDWLPLEVGVQVWKDYFPPQSIWIFRRVLVLEVPQDGLPPQCQVRLSHAAASQPVPWQWGRKAVVWFSRWKRRWGALTGSLSTRLEILIVLVYLESGACGDAGKHLLKILDGWTFDRNHLWASVQHCPRVCDRKYPLLVPPRSLGRALTSSLVPVSKNLRHVRAENLFIIWWRQSRPFQAFCRPRHQAEPEPDVADPLLPTAPQIFTCLHSNDFWSQGRKHLLLPTALPSAGRDEVTADILAALTPSQCWRRLDSHGSAVSPNCPFTCPRARMSTLGRDLWYNNRGSDWLTMNHLGDQGKPGNRHQGWREHLALDPGTRKDQD